MKRLGSHLNKRGSLRRVMLLILLGFQQNPLGGKVSKVQVGGQIGQCIVVGVVSLTIQLELVGEKVV